MYLLIPTWRSLSFALLYHCFQSQDNAVAESATAFLQRQLHVFSLPLKCICYLGCILINGSAFLRYRSSFSTLSLEKQLNLLQKWNQKGVTQEWLHITLMLLAIAYFAHPHVLKKEGICSQQYYKNLSFYNKSSFYD